MVAVRVRWPYVLTPGRLAEPRPEAWGAEDHEDDKFQAARQARLGHVRTGRYLLIESRLLEVFSKMT